MKRRADFLLVFFRVCFSNNRGNRGRETDSQRHRDENHRISQGYRRKFCTSEFSDHNVINHTNQRMAEHTQYDRISQLEVVGELFGVARKIHSKFLCKCTIQVWIF